MTGWAIDEVRDVCRRRERRARASWQWTRTPGVGVRSRCEAGAEIWTLAEGGWSQG